MCLLKHAVRWLWLEKPDSKAIVVISVPLIKFLVTDGWWITDQTIFANGGYTAR
ncbi:MAG TPA: hypothetical protein VFS35_01640 [Terrimicrobiaceae bacterium]|nr:hypothetical protein [Terrimicrobiaceae bacterium]